MPSSLAIAVSLHILAAMFWAGSTFAIARSGGNGAVKLFFPQMGAALVAIVAGGYLWHQLHSNGFGPFEQRLAVGAAAALAALLVQVAGAGPIIGTLRRSGAEATPVPRRVAIAYRIAAILLAIATLAMAAARYW
jgi:hypothetical protein